MLKRRKHYFKKICTSWLLNSLILHVQNTVCDLEKIIEWKQWKHTVHSSEIETLLAVHLKCAIQMALNWKTHTDEYWKKTAGRCNFQRWFNFNIARTLKKPRNGLLKRLQTRDQCYRIQVVQVLQIVTVIRGHSDWFLKKHWALSLAWTEVEFRFCPRLLLLKYWTWKKIWFELFSLSLSYESLAIVSEWEKPFFWPIVIRHREENESEKRGRPKVRLRSMTWG